MHRGHRERPLRLCVLCVLCGSTLLAQERPELTLGRSADYDYDPPVPGSYSLPVLKPAADGPVLGTDGRHRRLREVLSGKITLLSFVYTRCADPSACPYATAVLNDIHSISLRDPVIAESLRLVTFSFDPQYDTPRVLADYSQALRQRSGAEWLFVTTTGEEVLAPILQAYGQPRERKKNPADPLGPYSHLLRVYLVDRRGQIRNIYSSGLLDPRMVLTDVRTLLLEERKLDEAALARLRSPPLGLPAVRMPESNPATIEKITLGRKLFFDRRLSVNNTMSCAMCHIPEQGFTNNELSTAIGVEGRSLRRNAPTLLNVAYVGPVFLDGREPSLESQAVAPLLARDEMANPSAESLIAKVRGLLDYDRLFEAAFGGEPTMDRVAMAIATWERTLLSADAPFDRWRYGGEAEALTPEEKRGFTLFAGKAGCASCHSVGAEYALFADGAFHDTGVGYRRNRRGLTSTRVEIAPEVTVVVESETLEKLGAPRFIDHGRFEVTGDPRDRWRFRTPTLRNVALSAPYMHDGSFRSLEEVVRFYNRGGVPHPGLDPLIRALELGEEEIASLVAFLHSLTGSNVATLQKDARSVVVGN